MGEGAFAHGVQLFRDHALILRHVLPAHVWGMVGPATGRARGAVCRAMYAVDDCPFLLPMALLAAEAACGSWVDMQFAGCGWGAWPLGGVGLGVGLNPRGGVWCGLRGLVGVALVGWFAPLGVGCRCCRLYPLIRASSPSSIAFAIVGVAMVTADPHLHEANRLLYCH